MASPTIKRGKKRPSRSLPQRRPLAVPLLARRCVAWAVEVSLVATSALVPYGLGLYTESHSEAEPVPINPVLANTEEAIAKTLALPRRSEVQRQVAPLTNLFWWGALLTPIAVGGWQLYLLGKTGQTSPKRWFGIRVVTPSGAAPGLFRAGFREGVGRWGLPTGAAYLLWRYSGAFPDIGILLGLTGLMLVAEGATLWKGSRRRTLHDRVAGTFVVDAAQRFAPYAQPYPATQVWQGEQPVRVQVQNNRRFRGRQGDRGQSPHDVTTIVLTNGQQEEQRPHLWLWMRRHPGVTLLIFAFAGMVSVLGTFVGTQVYIQSQANQREFKQQKNEVFLRLVNQLSSSTASATAEQRAAILALASLDDPRAVDLLVDLLGQETNPAVLEAIQQAVVSTGSVALPALQSLNQSLGNDLKALQQQGSPDEQQLSALQLQASQQAIAKLLTIHSGQVHNAKLNRTYLGSTTGVPVQFTLTLNHADLSGIDFRGTVLKEASFQETRFYGAGEDGRLGTFDDWISDLSGADLKEADLTGAFLQNVSMNHTNLIRATLDRADLSNSQLVGANLSSAQLIGADLSQAVLKDASLTGANLGEAEFSRSNLRNANLGQVRAAGAQFSFADLFQSNWQGADLSAVDLSHANLRQANLSATLLSGTNLRNAQLQNANLSNANLSTADLRGANLAGADFQGVTFAISQPTESDQFLQAPPAAASVAKILGVNFAEVKNLNAQQIDFICTHGGRHPKCP